ncbi:MAG TPA: hypothetical protein V6C85_09105 [Allocoleopsis sp.]
MRKASFTLAAGHENAIPPDRTIENKGSYDVPFPRCKWYISCNRNLMSDKQKRHARLMPTLKSVLTLATLPIALCHWEYL